MKFDALSRRSHAALSHTAVHVARRRSHPPAAGKGRRWPSRHRPGEAGVETGLVKGVDATLDGDELIDGSDSPEHLEARRFR